MTRRKKILYVTPFFNYPPMDGGSVRSVNIFIELKKYFDIFLITYPNEQLERNKKFKKRSFIKSSFLVNDINLFQRIITKNLPGFSSHDVPAITSGIDKIIKQRGPFDYIYFATQLMAQVLLYKNWNIPKIIDLYDIYSSVIKKKIEHTRKLSPYYLIFYNEFKKVEKYEKKIFKKADILIAISKIDQNILYKHSFKNSIVVQNGVRIPKVKWTGLKNSYNIIMVANFYYAPNIEGLKWFIKCVWPLLNNYNEKFTLKIIGRHKIADRNLSQNQKKIIWLGEIDDLHELYQKAACAIVPILQGGGIKYKVLEAMAYGIPVVSTYFGVQGISHKGNVVVAKSDKEFANAIIKVIENSKNKISKSISSRYIIKSIYSWEDQVKKLVNEIHK